MELRIQGRNVSITPQLEGYVEKRLKKLERHLPRVTDVGVEVRWQETRSASDRASVEVTVNVDGAILRGEQRGATIEAATDQVADVLDRKLQRYKGRSYRSEQAKKAGHAPSIAEAEAAAALEALEAEAEESVGVVRVKQFAMKPITVEEAIEQMEALGHSFFMFLDGDAQSHRVVYRRQDGGYGVIQPRG